MQHWELSEVRFFQAFNHAGVGMAILSIEGAFIEVNQKMLTLTGYVKDELTATDFERISHSDDFREEHEKMEKLVNGSCSSVQFEKKIIRKDREVRWVVLNASCVRNDIDTPLYNVVHLQDISPRLFYDKNRWFTSEKRFFHKSGKPLYGLLTANLIKNAEGKPASVIAQVQDNTLRKAKTLNRTKIKFEHLFRHCAIGIGVTDHRGLIMDVNEALCQITGYSNQELVGVLITRFFHPEDEEPITQHFRNLADGKVEKFTLEQRCIHKSGRIINTVVTASMIRASLAAQEIIFAQIQDISNLLADQKRLEQANAVFELAQDFADMGSWRWPIDSDVVFCSRSLEKIFDFKKSASTSCNRLLAAIHADDRDKVIEGVKQCLRTATPFEIEHRIVLKNGNVKWLVQKGSARHDDRGNAVEIFGIAREVTAFKRVAEELRKSKEQYQLLAESGQELIGLYSLDGNFLYASPALNLVLGYEPKSILNTQKLIDLVHPDDKHFFMDTWQRVILEKGSASIDKVRIRHINGHYIWCEKSLKAVLNENSEVKSIRSLTRNIEARIIFENQLQQTNEQLRNNLRELKITLEAKEHFLSIMSHEIRTPLNAVIGLSNLLARRDPREDQAVVVKTLMHSAETLKHLVNDTLDFSKIRAGKLLLESMPFSLSEFLQQLHDSFNLAAQEKGLDFTFYVDPRIPDLVSGDVTRLNQIFTNLIANAIKFTHHGQVKLRAEINSISEEKLQISFRVEDSGVGIPADKVETVFLPFQQASSAISRKYGGTGLGLSIVKSLVDLMGGKIKLSSELGKGSVFTIDLWFSREDHPRPAAQKPVLAISAPKKKQSILYVEDVAANRFLVENLLADEGMNCTSVSSGAAALRLTKIIKFNVILMDIQMPFMSGYQASEKIRKQAAGKNRDTPIIAFTAEPYSSELKNEALRHGIQHVIMKPFDPDDLIAKIRRYANTSKKGPIFSFSFYERAFGNDTKNLNKIKKRVIADLTRFENKLAQKSEKKDLNGMREEIHRIRPIVKNLQCTGLIRIFDAYRLHNSPSPATRKLTYDAIKLTQRLTAALRKPKSQQKKSKPRLK